MRAVLTRVKSASVTIDGEVTGKYRALPTTKSESHVAQGICVKGEDMYVFCEYANIHRVRTESGVYKRVLAGATGKKELLLGLAADKGGHVHYLARKTDGSGVVLRLGSGAGAPASGENRGVLASAGTETMYLGMTAENGKVSVFRKTSSGEIKRRVYRLVSVYTVL